MRGKTISYAFCNYTVLRISIVLVTSGVSNVQSFEITVKERFKLSNRMTECDVSYECDCEAP
jgi:hypothetical protein